MAWSRRVKWSRLPAQLIEHVAVATKVYLVRQCYYFFLNCLRLRCLLLPYREQARLVLQLLLHVYLIHEVTQTMDLCLLYLISILSYLLILIQVLKLQLTFHIELDSFYKIFICIFKWLPSVCWLICIVRTLQKPVLVLVELVLNLELYIIEIEKRYAWICILSDLNFNFFFCAQLHDKLDNGLQSWFFYHMLDITLHSLDVQTLQRLWQKRV